MINLAVVVTTVQEPTESMFKWLEVLDYFQTPLVVVGDKKGPWAYPIKNGAFLTWADTQAAGNEFHLLAAGLPDNSYVRKMHGYLHAMKGGAMCIYETDDDNAPLSSWSPRLPFVSSVRAKGNDWTNAYSLYDNRNIWPRGFPPAKLKDEDAMVPLWQDKTPVGRYSPVQQGLANGAPDVDALWRLTIGEEPFEFRHTGNYEIAPGSFAPFNSQSTWWWPEAFTLMYLPVTVPWRATDIWRSLVAQRILWERDRSVTFVGPEVFQDRNEHDLLKDFEEEQLVYLKVAEAAEALRNVQLTNYVSHRSNMVDCYRALVDVGAVDHEELRYLHDWLRDVKEIMDQREEV